MAYTLLAIFARDQKAKDIVVTEGMIVRTDFHCVCEMELACLLSGHVMSCEEKQIYAPSFFLPSCFRPPRDVNVAATQRSLGQSWVEQERKGSLDRGSSNESNTERVSHGGLQTSEFHATIVIELTA